MPDPAARERAGNRRVRRSGAQHFGAALGGAGVRSRARGKAGGVLLMRVRPRAAVVTAAVVALSLGGATAAQAAPSFHCQASALRVTLAGQQTVEPVTVG